MQAMTHSEFNHILGSIKELSPEQIEELRPSWTAGLPHRPSRAVLHSRRQNWPTRRHSGTARGGRNQRNQTVEAGADGDGAVYADYHPGRAAVGYHHPRAPLRWLITSWIAEITVPLLRQAALLAETHACGGKMPCKWRRL